MEKLVLKVEGMACEHCEITIQDAVRKLPGIKKVKASKRKKEVVAEYEPDQVTEEQIRKAIDDTGYKIVS